MKTIYKYILNIIIGIFIIILILAGIKLKPMIVLSNSMSPLLQQGDMIITKYILPENVKIGDVITFRAIGDILITHRLTEIVNKDGKLMFITKGDANDKKDNNIVSPDQLVGKLIIGIPKGGYIVNLIKSPIGFILLFFLPIIFIFKGVIRKILL